MTDIAAPADPDAVLARYHSRREQAVTAPQGNLALVNTQWITGDPASEQPVWGVPGVWSPLPAGQSGLKVTAAATDNIFVDEVLPPTAALMSSIYEEHKDEDGYDTFRFSFLILPRLSSPLPGATHDRYRQLGTRGGPCDLDTWIDLSFCLINRTTES